jgi:hypothetical protein
MKTKPKKNLPEKEKSNLTTEPITGVEEAFLDTDEMIEFADAQAAATHAVERGEAEVLMPAALMQLIFQQTQPLELPHLRQAWNRVCDELGKPEEKKAEPPPIEYEEGKGPF